ncbi:MAG: GNAT family N-acetyltransferase [Acidimicrobiales bacterium]
MPVEIRREDLSDPVARELIAALNAEIRRRYPNPLDWHFDLTTEDVDPGRGAFVVATAGNADVACGAVRLIGEGIAELKRMFVIPAFRKRGIGSAVLAFLESEARAIGAARIVLETGIRSPEGLALYRRAGYEEIEKYGPYVYSEVSVCMGKDLAAE